MRKRILIINENVDEAEKIKERLVSAYNDVECVTSISDAVNRFVSMDFTLVILDANMSMEDDGKRVALYAKTAEELYEKVEEAKRQIEEASFRRATPTVAEYCERWLLMQSAHIRTTTLTDYSSKVKNYIVAPLGHMYMANVTTDDVRLALVAASEKSNSVYRSVHMLYKAIFNSAVDSNIIDYSPCERISAKGGKPQKDKEALTDEQIVKLLSAIKGLKIAL